MEKVETSGFIQTEEAGTQNQDLGVLATASTEETAETPKITSATIARTVCLALAIINQALMYFGIQPLPFVNDELYELASNIALFVTAAIAWWKNNSFTLKARKADVLPRGGNSNA